MNMTLSTRQLKRLMILDIFANCAYILPGVLGRSGTAAVLPGFFAGGAAVLVFWYFMLWMESRSGLYKGEDYLHYLNRVTGHLPALVIAGAWSLIFFINAVRMTGMYLVLITDLLPGTCAKGSAAVLIGLLLWYMTAQGMSVRGRLGEVLIYVVVVPVVFICLMALNYMYWPWVGAAAGLGMDMTAGTASGLTGSMVVNSGFLAFAMILPAENILFIRPVQREKWQRKKCMAGLYMGTLIAGLILAVCLGLLSPQGLAKEPWPFYTVLQIIRIPGSFLSRYDGLVLMLWLGTAFLIISAGCIYISEIMKAAIGTTFKMSKKITENNSRYHWMEGMICGTVIITALWLQPYAMLEMTWLEWSCFISLPAQLLLAALPLVMEKIKEKGRH